MAATVHLLWAVDSEYGFVVVDAVADGVEDLEACDSGLSKELPVVAWKGIEELEVDLHSFAAADYAVAFAACVAEAVACAVVVETVMVEHFGNLTAVAIKH